MQNQEAIDFRPLAFYSKLFLFFRTVKRIKMVLVRIVFCLVILAIVGYLAYVLIMIQQHPEIFNEGTETQTYEGSYVFNESGQTYNLLEPLFVLFAIYFGPTIVTLLYMGSIWKKFASVNGFRVLERMMPDFKEIMNVPSFRGKLLSTSVGPVIGRCGGSEFALFTRQYREGGILRWRERQMDTVFTLFVPARLPHIVINAKANERARRSNLSGKFEDSWKFKFEGVQGEHYDVYASPENRIVALQLFTPDVLAVLYNMLPTTDIELMGDKIWFIERYGVLDDKRAKAIFDAVGSIESELHKQLLSARLYAVQT